MQRSDLFSLLAVIGTAAAIAGADEFDPWKSAAVYELEYAVDLGPLAGRDDVRVWIPLPATNTHQRLLGSVLASPWPARITHDEHGNRFLYLEPDGPQPEPVVHLRWVIERQVHRGRSAPAPPADSPYLKPCRRIPLDGELRSISQRLCRGLDDPGARQRVIYDHVLASMTYSKHGQGWGRGDALWACRAGYGNCTDFHSLLIGLCRCANIPARFVMGFPMPDAAEPTPVRGYHCWAEVYEPGVGWVGIDASEAAKSGRKEAYFGTLPADRIEFTVGRDLRLVPPQAGEPLNYFIYPYAEVAGRPVEQVPWRLQARRLPAPTSTSKAGPTARPAGRP